VTADPTNRGNTTPGLQCLIHLAADMATLIANEPNGHTRNKHAAALFHIESAIRILDSDTGRGIPNTHDDTRT
jgi:hypothetical protein